MAGDCSVSGYLCTLGLAKLGGVDFHIHLAAVGNDDLDLYVYDVNGYLITKDEDNTDRCYVSWTPRWTGAFYIVVKNRGNVRNRYTMVTN